MSARSRSRVSHSLVMRTRRGRRMFPKLPEWLMAGLTTGCNVHIAVSQEEVQHVPAGLVLQRARLSG